MKNIYIYLGIIFLFALAMGLILPIYTMFLIALGLSKGLVMILQTIFTLSCCIFDIPTGILADSWGKKKCIVISCLIVSLSFLTYSIADNLLICILSEILLACGFCFGNGALQAWAINTTPDMDEKKLGKLFAQEQIFRSLGNILGGFIGVALYESTHSGPWLLGGLLFAFYTPFLFWVITENIVPKKQSSYTAKIADFKKDLVKSIEFIRISKPYKFCLIMTAVHLLAVQAPNQYWQLIFTKHLPENQLDFGFASLVVAMLVGSTLSGYLIGYCRNSKLAIITCQVAIGLLVALTVMSNSMILMAGCFLIHEAARGAFRTIKDAYLNQNIPKEMRATLVSATSTFGNAGTLIGQLMCYFITTFISMEMSWVVTGLLLVMVTIVVKNGKKERG